jgi:hypothetical protein
VVETARPLAAAELVTAELDDATGPDEATGAPELAAAESRP